MVDEIELQRPHPGQRRQHRAHPCAATTGTCVHRAAVDVHHAGGVVIHDYLTGDFIVERGADIAPKNRTAREFHGIGLAVVFDQLGLAFHEFIRPTGRCIALLTEKCELAGFCVDDAELVAVLVLGHLQTRAADQHRALGQHHLAGKYADLLGIVVTQRIGLDIHRLFAIGTFGHGNAALQKDGQQQCVRNSGELHRGTNLAVNPAVSL